ncbi:hypothetical protein P6709_13420 [Jeotgalibacillus sp. ET6]|uniref:hypothetical protein n=1 Tax=Jeotgalibacillus sp. ET6 TaxID=3037260 RepID=UPI002418AE14|nr:hypothetical protein [Jeotgalibacillus sp. ET6]MDG5472751.1 hypothetical protein [Jeotgalibacillus sp. ET6]
MMIIDRITKKQVRVSLLLGLGAGVVLFTAAFIAEASWILHAPLPILLLSLAPYFYFSASYKNNERRREAQKTESKDMLQESEWIFMREGAGGGELVILNKNGEYIGVYKSVNVPAWLKRITIFIAWVEGFFASTKGIFDSHGQPVAGIQKVSEKGSVTLEVNNRRGETAGYYEEHRAVSSLKTHGTLKRKDGSVWLSVNMSTSAGDFLLKDAEGRFIASYRFGYFDYALSEPFKNGTGYELVKVNESLTEDEKTLLSALVCHWMGYKLQGAG